MAVVFDYIFIFTGGFAVGFIWSRYYFKDVTVCFLIGLFAALIFLCGGRLVFKKHFRKSNAKKEKADVLRAAAKFIALEEKALPAIADAYRAKGFGVTFYKTSLLCFSAEKVFFVTVVSSHTGEKNACDTIGLCRRLKVGHLFVFSVSPLQELNVFGKHSGVEVSFIGQEECAALLKDSEELKAYIPEKTKRLPPLLKGALSKAHAKYYFISALFLSLTSFVAFFPFYYLIGATVLFVLALLSRFRAKA